MKIKINKYDNNKITLCKVEINHSDDTAQADDFVIHPIKNLSPNGRFIFIIPKSFFEKFKSFIESSMVIKNDILIYDHHGNLIKKMDKNRSTNNLGNISIKVKDIDIMSNIRIPDFTDDDLVTICMSEYKFRHIQSKDMRFQAFNKDYNTAFEGFQILTNHFNTSYYQFDNHHNVNFRNNTYSAFKKVMEPYFGIIVKGINNEATLGINFYQNINFVSPSKNLNVTIRSNTKLEIITDKRVIDEVLFIGLDYEENSLQNGVTWNWVDSAGTLSPGELTCNNFGLLDYDYLVYLADFIYLDNLIKNDTQHVEENLKNNKDILFNALFCNIESDNPKQGPIPKCKSQC